jgi:hypothetical protein
MKSEGSSDGSNLGVSPNGANEIRRSVMKSSAKCNGVCPVCLVKERHSIVPNRQELNANIGKLFLGGWCPEILSCQAGRSDDRDLLQCTYPRITYRTCLPNGFRWLDCVLAARGSNMADAHNRRGRVECGFLMAHRKEGPNEFGQSRSDGPNILRALERRWELQTTSQPYSVNNWNCFAS